MVYKLDAGMDTMKNFKLFYEFPENFMQMDWFKSNMGSPRKTLNSVCFTKFIQGISDPNYGTQEHMEVTWTS